MISHNREEKTKPFEILKSQPLGTEKCAHPTTLRDLPTFTLAKSGQGISGKNGGSGRRTMDLEDRASEELWLEVRNIVQEAVTKTSPKKEKELHQS